MKKLICIMCALLLCMGIFGCTKKEEKPKVFEPIDIEVLQKILTEADPSLPETITINSNSENAQDSFSYISDIDYSKIENYFLCYANTPVADEIAVICVKDEKDAENALETLIKHSEERISMFSTYAPEEATRLENAVAFCEGHYAVLIICDDAKAVETAFRNAIKNEA